MAIGKQKFHLTKKDWFIEGNFFKWKYQIKCGENKIAEISQKLLYWGDTYLINFNQDEDELLILMTVLAIDIANAPSKTKELKRTVKEKTHYWF